MMFEKDKDGKIISTSFTGKLVNYKDSGLSLVYEGKEKDGIVIGYPLGTLLEKHYGSQFKVTMYEGKIVLESVETLKY